MTKGFPQSLVAPPTFGLRLGDLDRIGSVVGQVTRLRLRVERFLEIGHTTFSRGFSVSTDVILPPNAGAHRSRCGHEGALWQPNPRFHAQSASVRSNISPSPIK